MNFTNVHSYAFELKFPEECKNWWQTPPEILFDIKLIDNIRDTSIPTIWNIESQCMKEVFFWTDCDWEGEALC